MRRTGRILIATLTLVLGALTAAYAATGTLPLLPRTLSARAIVLEGGGALIANDREGQAVLSASRMVPGSWTSGAVVLGNPGDRGGELSLALADPLDTSTPLGLFSAALQLEVDDVTPGVAPRVIYHGALGALATVPAGRLEAGASRTFRFIVSMPSRGDALDNAYQGASTTVGFQWTAATAVDGGPAPTRPTAPPAATPPADAPPVTGPQPTVPAQPDVPVQPAGPGIEPAARASLTAGTTQRLRKGRLSARFACSAACSGTLTGTLVAKRRSGTSAARAKKPETRVGRAKLALRRAGARTVRLKVSARTGQTVRLTLRVRIGRRTLTVRRVVRVR